MLSRRRANTTPTPFMDVTLTTQGNWTVVIPETPRLDAQEASELKRVLRQGIPRSDTHVVFDLGRVEFIDSSGLGALVSCRQWIHLEHQVVLAAVHPAVAMILRLSHLDKVFPIFPSVASALEGASVTHAR